MPGYWNEYTVDGRELPRFGFGTYRAVILLPSGYRDRMGFDMPVFDTSYEIAVRRRNHGKKRHPCAQPGRIDTGIRASLLQLCPSKRHP
ncbi:MAG: hypothetical protein U5L72_09700 [Bacteroidales bacterium]|nr:hypothetical protein [Bacteroidales bacterium]